MKPVGLRRLTYIGALLAWGFFPRATAAAAEPNEPPLRFGYDVSYKVGFVRGRMEKPPDGTTPAKIFEFAGAPIGMALNHEISPYFSFFYQFSLVLDFSNEMVTRMGVEAGTCVHMLGGSRRAIIESHEGYQLLARSGHNLSACTKGSYFNYAASNKENLAQRVTGSIIENLYGLQYRLEFNDAVAVGFEVFATAFNIPASVDRLSIHSQEMMIFLRTYI